MPPIDPPILKRTKSAGMNFTWLALWLVSAFVRADEPEWADLQIRFVYGAPEPPPRRRILPLPDTNCLPESLMPLAEDLIVDSETGGIRNVAVYLDPKTLLTSPLPIHPSLRLPSSHPARLTTRGCAFEPHLLVARVGQPLRMLNNDEFGHNPHFVLFANGLESRMQPPGQQIEMTLAQSEKAPSPVLCNLHPWMRAYLLVFDHPYAAISDEKGLLVLEKLPAERPISLKIWHESMAKSIDDVELNGQPVRWPQGTFSLTLTPGLNELGEVRIPAEKFKPSQANR